jgi:DNA-binding CsgD family transcriptional regulator
MDDKHKSGQSYYDFIAQEVVREFEENVPLYKIATHYNISRYTVFEILKKSGHPYYNRVAAKNHKILQDLADGKMTQAEIAEKYGVSPGTVCTIKKRGY